MVHRLFTSISSKGSPKKPNGTHLSILLVFLGLPKGFIVLLVTLGFFRHCATFQKNISSKSSSIFFHIFTWQNLFFSSPKGAFPTFWPSEIYEHFIKAILGILMRLSFLNLERGADLIHSCLVLYLLVCSCSKKVKL